jgi:hypothetical protein
MLELDGGQDELVVRLRWWTRARCLAVEVSVALGGRVKRGEASTAQRQARYFIR